MGQIYTIEDDLITRWKNSQQLKCRTANSNQGSETARTELKPAAVRLKHCATSHISKAVF
jgi:hypothetical protein